MQPHTFGDSYHKTYKPQYQNLKTGMGRELRKESIACRPCSLNFDDKLKRKVPDFCAAHLLRCHFLFAFYHEICVYIFEFLKEKTHQNLAF